MLFFFSYVAVVHRSKTINKNLTVNSGPETTNQLFLRNNLWLAHVYHDYFYVDTSASSMINSYVKELQGELTISATKFASQWTFWWCSPLLFQCLNGSCIFYVFRSDLPCETLHGRRGLRERAARFRKQKSRGQKTQLTSQLSNWRLDRSASQVLPGFVPPLGSQPACPRGRQGAPGTTGCPSIKDKAESCPLRCHSSQADHSSFLQSLLSVLLRTRLLCTAQPCDSVWH